MIWMGLDIATCTGIALFDTDKPRSAIEAFTIKLEGDSSEEKAWGVPRKLKKLFAEHGVPDFVAVEQAPKQAYTSIHPTIQLNVLHGAYFAVLGDLCIPGQTVTDSTWRKAMLGMGRQKGWKSADWKRRAKELCAAERIPCSNADEAEAILLALWASTNSTLAQQIRLDQMRQTA